MGRLAPPVARQGSLSLPAVLPPVAQRRVGIGVVGARACGCSRCVAPLL